jgi:hypothetical protein
MLLWLQNNWGTILVSAVLVAVLAVVVFFMIRAKKNGKSSCGCSGCSGNCPGCAVSRQK